jgi:glyoxylase-like metal-dependent hydrolase (beta-lactamase superfamily II)
MLNEKMFDEVEENIFIIYGDKPSSHSYLLKGLFKNVLIDTGTKSNFQNLVETITRVGLKVSDIHLVICTHEHYDHIGCIGYFYETAIIAADRFAATKIELNDEYVIHAAIHDEEPIRTHVNVWLENRVLFDFGNYKLKVLHTPGHTSGCICLYEPFHHFMFTGDTVFSGGAISKISDSGSHGDYINSLERLNTYKVDRMFPGHGKICENPAEALSESIVAAKARLREYSESLSNRKTCEGMIG